MRRVGWYAYHIHTQYNPQENPLTHTCTIISKNYMYSLNICPIVISISNQSKGVFLLKMSTNFIRHMTSFFKSNFTFLKDGNF